MKKISPSAYQALRDAIPAIIWNKRPFETFLRTALREHGELLAYKLPLEQIDGSFTFDTDDYIIEARWRAAPADRGDGDIFASKVCRKGKNAVGLFISVNSFTEPFREAYRENSLCCHGWSGSIRRL